MGWRTTPSPVQVGQAPAGLLNEKFAMPISGIAAPQCGQGKVPSGLSSDSSCPVFVRGFKCGRWNILPTGRAGTVPEPGV